MTKATQKKKGLFGIYSSSEIVFHRYQSGRHDTGAVNESVHPDPQTESRNSKNDLSLLKFQCYPH